MPRALSGSYDAAVRRSRRISSAPLAAALLLAASCTTVPPGFTTAPADRGLAYDVSRIAARAGGRWGIAALHIESGRRLEWNASSAFEAASVVKLALLTEAAARIQEKTLEPGARWTLTEAKKAAPSSVLDDFEAGLDPTEHDLLVLMIARSDNTAANRFIDLFGAEAVNRRMERLGLGEIRLTGRIPDKDPEETQAGRWKGLKLGSMTARATVELYQRVATGKLLGAVPDELMWGVLSEQHQVDRIPRLAGEEIGSQWAGKTGTLRGVRVDSGVLTLKSGRYVFAMFVDQIPDAPNAPQRVTHAMGEIAKRIVDAWSRPAPGFVVPDTTSISPR
jgi:beta-lactamase class A